MIRELAHYPASSWLDTFLALWKGWYSCGPRAAASSSNPGIAFEIPSPFTAPDGFGSGS
jgi:hypothetical protein